MRLAYFYLIIIVFYFSSNALGNQHAQASNFDRINSLPDDSLKVLELNELSFQYMGTQLDTAFILGQRALDLSEEINFEYGVAKSLFQLGMVLRYQCNYKKAIEYSKRAYDLFEKMNKSAEKARVLNSLGNVYKRIGDYNKSVESFLASLTLYTALNDSLKVSYVMNNLGVLYLSMGENEKSLDFHLQNLEMRRKLGADKDLVLMSLMNIGIVYREMRNYNVALEYYKEAISLIDNNTSKHDQLLLLYNMGNIFESKRFKKC